MQARHAAIVLSLAFPLSAVAKSGTPPPAPAMKPGPSRAVDARGEAVRREPAFHFVLQGGFDFGLPKLVGSTELVEVPRLDGTRVSLRANQGLNLSAGAAFLKIAGGRVATQVTIGAESWEIDASGGGATWRAFPLEVMELFYLDPIRIGVGASILLSPSLEGYGALESLDVEYENSLGFVFQVDWVARDTASARRGRLTFGPRFVIQKLTPKEPGASAIDANSFGVVVGFTG